MFPAMRSGLLWTLLVLLMSSLSAASPVQAPAPWLGTWRLNVDESPESPNAQQYKRVTTRIEAWGDGIRVIYDMVGKRGGVTHLEWQGKFDGQDYPVQGTDTFLTNAYSRISDRSYRIEVKLDGTPVATTIVDVSPDQDTLTAITSDRTRPNQRQTWAIYDKVR